MNVSNQALTNPLLARTQDKMDPQHLRLRKLFAGKQAEIANRQAMPAELSAASKAKAARSAAAMNPALGTQPGTPVKGGPSAKSPAVALGTGTGTGTGGGIAPLPGELTAELSVEGLMARWGAADTAYDLDKSGSVDMKDLVMLLSKQDEAKQGPVMLPGKPMIAPETASPELGVTEAMPLSTTAPTAGVEGTDPGTTATPSMTDFMKAWGTDDPAFDLDGDGTVGMNDLLTMLAQGGTDAPLGTGTTADPEDPAAQLTVDGFAAAWGTDDPMYDLDGDGTVGMPDLLAHLATVSPATAGITGGNAVPEELGTQAPAAFAGVLSDTAPVSPRSVKDARNPEATITFGGVDPALSLAATLDRIESTPAAGGPLSTSATAPGEKAPAGTGGLDMAMLGGPSSYFGIAAAASNPLDLATLAGLADPNTQAASIETPQQAADILAKQLQERFGAFGFNEAPPSNLHEILDGLRLADGDRKMVLERMHGLYPNGLGLNLMG